MIVWVEPQSIGLNKRTIVPTTTGAAMIQLDEQLADLSHHIKTARDKARLTRTTHPF